MPKTRLPIPLLQCALPLRDTPNPSGRPTRRFSGAGEKIKTNHQLALSADEMDRMVRSVTFVQVADWLNSYVVKRHPDKETLRQKWMATYDPMAARAGWAPTTERVVKSP